MTKKKEFPFRRVLVIGSPGAGKSVFSRALSEKTGLPLYHLDLIWHRPDKSDIGREAFAEALEALLQRDAFIIDGNYMHTMARRLLFCEHVFLFDLPTELCLSGAASRTGKKRPDLPWIEETPDPVFFEYIRTFREEKLPKIRDILCGSAVPVTVFHSREDADAFLADL